MSVPLDYPSISLIIGPMYSGKTTEVMRRLSIYANTKLPILYINCKLDTRSDKNFSTHNDILGDAEFAFQTIKAGKLSDIFVDNFKVIAVDEAGFFPDLLETVTEWADKKEKIVIVAGLSGDFQRSPFGQINDLLSRSDTVTVLSPFCALCHELEGKIFPAPFSLRMSANKEKILVGGSDIYKPACRKCYLKHSV